MMSVWRGLKMTGKAGLTIAPGKLTAFGFTDEELGEIIDEDMEAEKYLDMLYEERRNQPTIHELREMFIKDGVVTREWANEVQSKQLLEKHNIAYRALAEAQIKQKPKTEIMQKAKEYNQAKFYYNVFAYRPDYADSTVSEAELAEARRKEMKHFITLNNRRLALCPFHNERTPSFKVDRNLWYCFGCGEAGDTIKFVMKQRNCGFKEAVKVINSL